MARARLSVVDSSAWLEYFADGPGAKHFASPIEAVTTLLVPTICLLEVFKVVLRERDENDALQAAALMQQGQLVELDPPLALAAAQLGVAHKLPLADSIVYATAQAFGAVLVDAGHGFRQPPRRPLLPQSPAIGHTRLTCWRQRTAFARRSIRKPRSSPRGAFCSPHLKTKCSRRSPMSHSDETSAATGIAAERGGAADVRLSDCAAYGRAAISSARS